MKLNINWKIRKIMTTTTTQTATKVKLFMLFAHFILLFNGQQSSAQAFSNIEQNDTTVEPDDEMEIGCDFLENRRWKLVCDGVYSRELKLKYKDRIVNEGVLYKVWQDEDAPIYTRLLITFYESKLFACSSLRYINQEFYCDSAAAPLQLPQSEVHCLPFTYSYADNLRERCQLAPRRVRAAASAIQYARRIDDEDSASTFKPSALIILIVNVVHFFVD